ncbi:MAG TPA: polysaccharide deacetylase family protein, partial [Solirubrobacteraceae bacterium]|nr:polysaccharide deacetylase family protein [Solirubrobacteraceae bacterium]
MGAAQRALRRPFAGALERALRMTSLRAGLVLVYHEVTAAARRDPWLEVTPVVDAQMFSAHLRHLNARHRIVALHELAAAATERRRGQPFPVALTFDDDLRTHLDTALPRLRAAGATATFFLTGRSLAAPASFWWERLQRAIDAGLVPADGGARAVAARIQALPAPAREAVSDDLLRRLGGELPDWGLRAEHVRELAGAGCEIGFHTRRHEALTELDDARLAGAMHDGREALEAAAGSALRAIAYPHGAADARVASAARTAGYAVGVTTDPHAVRAGADPLLLGRIYPSPASVAGLATGLT